MSDAGKPEQEIARRLLDNMANIGKKNEELETAINDLKANVKKFEGVDLSDVSNKDIKVEVERLKGAMEQMKMDRRVAARKSGQTIPGLETESKNFSLIRAMTAIHSNNWTKAGFEKDVFAAARTKAQAMGVDSAGGYFVPDEIIEDVIAAIYTQSAMINLSGEGTTRVSVLDGLNGGTVKIPKFMGGLVAYWIGESDEYSDSTSKVGDVVMNPKKLGVLVRLTQEMRTYASYGFENLLRTDMVRAAAKTLDKAILYGSGSANQPRGVINSVNASMLAKGDLKSSPSVQAYDAENKTFWNGGTKTGMNTDNAKRLDFDGLDNMIGALEDADVQPDASAAVIAHPKFFRKLRQLKADQYSAQNGVAAPYLLGSPRLNDARLADIIGNFGRSTQVPTTNQPGASLGWTASASQGATNTDVFVGNWNDVVLGRWGGIEIEDDGGRGKGFTADHTYLKLRLYVDVGFRHEQSIVVCPNANIG